MASRKEINGILVVDTIEEALEALQNGKSVARYEFGESMLPIFESGEYAILTPIKDISEVKQGDAVFCQLGEHFLTHLVWMKSNNFCLIGGSNASLNGWTNKVYAIASKTDVIEPYFEEKIEE